MHAQEMRKSGRGWLKELREQQREREHGANSARELITQTHTAREEVKKQPDVLRSKRLEMGLTDWSQV